MKDLQFWLLNKDKKPLYENTSGLVSHVDTGVLKPDGLPAHLNKSPDGWRNTIIKWVRNINYIGVVRDFTVPLRFVIDGAKIIKDTMWRQGVDAILYLSILKLNKTEFPDKYEHWYTGEIDLSKLSQKTDGIQVQCTEGGLVKLFKANENTTYDIPLSGNVNKKIIRLDGATLIQNANFGVYDGSLFFNNGQHTLNLELLSTESIQEIGAVSTNRTHFKNNLELVSQNNWFLTTGAKPVTITIKYNIGFYVDLAVGITPNPAAGGRLLIRCFNRDNVATDAFILHDYGGSSDLYQHHQLTNTLTITIPAERKCFLCNFLTISGVIASGSAADEVVFWTYDSTIDDKFEIDYTFVAEPTLCECIQPLTLCQGIIDKIAPGFSVSSSFLESIKDSVLITSGPALRKYRADAVIKTSFSDFYKSFKRYGIGVGIEGDKLIIEKYPYFFKTGTPILNLGEIDDYEISIAEELIFNTIKYGSPTVDLKKVNGRDEFNATVIASTPIKKIVKEHDLLSVYHDSMFEIETTRFDLYGKDTTDSPVDNTPFMLSSKKGSIYEYYNGEFTVEGTTSIKITKTLTEPVIGEVLTISATPATNDGNHTIASYTIVPGETNIGIGLGLLTNGSYNGTINIVSNEYYSLLRENYSSVTGLRHPEDAFNIELSPKRSIINNGQYLRSVLDYLDFESLKVVTSERSTLLTTIKDGITISESSDEPIGGLGDQLFKPYLIKFKAKSMSNYYSVIRDNPYSLISFKIGGDVFTGYLWDGGVNPDRNSEQDFTLLMGPNNDLTKLINL